MQIGVRKMAKTAGAVCAATGIVALSALVASGAAVGAVIEGFKSAGNTMRKLLADEVGKKEADDEQWSGDDDAEDNTIKVDEAKEVI